MAFDARSVLRRPARLAASSVLPILAIAGCGSTSGDAAPPADAGTSDATVADGGSRGSDGSDDGPLGRGDGDAPPDASSYTPKLLAAGSDLWIEGVTDDGHAIVHRGAALVSIALADGTTQVLADAAPAAVLVSGSTVVFWTGLVGGAYALDAWTASGGKRRLSTAANASYGTPPAVVSTDGKQIVFVENVGASTADVVVAATDGSHRQKLTSDALSRSTFRAQIATNGTVFVEHGSPPALSAFVGPTFTQHDLAPFVSGSPWVVDPAGAYAFFPSATSGAYPSEWRLAEVATGKVTTFAIGADRALFSPSGDAIYFDVPNTLDLQRLPLSTRVPELLVGDTCAHLVALAPDGSTALCHGRSPAISAPTLAIVPLKGPSVAAILQQSAAAYYVSRYAYTADAKSIFYFTAPDAPASPDPTLGELDVVAADGSAREVVAPGPYGAGYALTGSLVAYGDAARGEVSVLDTSGNAARRVVARNVWTTLGAPRGWTKTPDGKSILYVAWGNAPGLYLVSSDADASSVPATPSPGVGPGGLLVAGDRVYPYGMTSDGAVLFLRHGLEAADASGGGVTTVAAGGSPLAIVGQTVVYTEWSGGARPLYTWSKSTGSHAITTSSYDLGQYGPGFTLSPDATRIAFLDGARVLSTGVTGNMAVANVDGSGKHTVMTGLDLYHCPPQMTLTPGGRLFVQGCLAVGDAGTPTPTLWTFQLSQATTPSAVALATSPSSWTVPETGAWAWVTLAPPASGGELVRADTAEVTPVDSTATAGWFDAAGDTLFYTTSAGALLRTPLGGAVQPTTLVAGGVGTKLATSPDGNLVAFASTAAAPFDLHVALAAPPPFSSTVHAPVDLVPAGDLFTADSRFVVFETQGGTLFSAMPLGGGPFAPIAGQARVVQALHDSLVFADDWTSGDLRVVDASGTLPPRSIAPSRPWVLSPDRKTLAFEQSGSAPGLYAVTLP